MADGHIPATCSVSMPDVMPHVAADGAVDADRRPEATGDALDKLGVGISLGCAVHCVAVGALSALPSFAASFMGGAVSAATLGIAWLEMLEWPLLLGAAIVGAVSLFPAYRHHGARAPLAFFGLGMILLAASRFSADGLEIALTTLGVGAVATGHVLNLRAHGARPHRH